MQIYKLWENTTGTSWSEAKTQGLTDGTAIQNHALEKRLLAGEFGEATAPPLTEEEGRKTIAIEDVGNVNVSKLWENVTGTKWEEAKNQNLTDGSLEKNLDLRDKLITGAYGEVVTSTNPQKEEDNKVTQTEIAEVSNEIGPNQIVEDDNSILSLYKRGRKYVTNMAGELVRLASEQIKQAGLDVEKTKKYIEDQNKQVESPYTTKDTVKLEPEWKEWGEVKEKYKGLNKMDQADLITNFKAGEEGDSPYIIIDKKKGLINLYKQGSTELISSAPVDIGAVIGDAQTHTVAKMSNKETLLSIQEKLGVEVDGTFGDETKDAIREYNKEHNSTMKFVPKYNVDWANNNKSTGAGHFTVSNISYDGYKNLPTFNMRNDRQNKHFNETGNNEQVSTTIHAGYVPDDKNRVSNGCIRCSKATVQELYSMVQNGTEIYILPEDEGNNFAIENGKLNFNVGSEKNYNEYYRPLQKNGRNVVVKHAKSDDISKFSPGSLGITKTLSMNPEPFKGQGINTTVNTLNHIPIKIEDNYSKEDYEDYKTENSDGFFGWNIMGDYDFFNRNRALLTTALTKNKQRLMKDLGINGDIYNEIAQLSVGIPNAETKYGTHQKYLVKSRHGDVVNTLKSWEGNNSANSVGMNQIKYKALIQNTRIKELFKAYGITEDKLNVEHPLDGYYSGLATMILLADMYTNELNGKEILTESGVEWQDALLYLYQGKRSELKNRTATPEKNLYIQDVKKGSKGFTLFQLD